MGDGMIRLGAGMEKMGRAAPTRMVQLLRRPLRPQITLRRQVGGTHPRTVKSPAHSWLQVAANTLGSTGGVLCLCPRFASSSQPSWGSVPLYFRKGAADVKKPRVHVRENPDMCECIYMCVFVSFSSHRNGGNAHISPSCRTSLQGGERYEDTEKRYKRS